MKLLTVTSLLSSVLLQGAMVQVSAAKIEDCIAISCSNTQDLSCIATCIANNLDDIQNIASANLGAWTQLASCANSCISQTGGVPRIDEACATKCIQGASGALSSAVSSIMSGGSTTATSGSSATDSSASTSGSASGSDSTSASGTSSGSASGSDSTSASGTSSGSAATSASGSSSGTATTSATGTSGSTASSGASSGASSTGTNTSATSDTKSSGAGSLITVSGLSVAAFVCLAATALF